MRSTVEFKVNGKTHKNIVDQVQKLICAYLGEDSVEAAMSAVDVEIKVQQDGLEANSYNATAHVRIK